MQIIGDRSVRVVPDVAVSGNGSGGGLVDGLLGMMMRNQNGKKASASQLKSPPPASESNQQLPASHSSESVLNSQPSQPANSLPNIKVSKPTTPNNNSASSDEFAFAIDELDTDII